MLVGRVEEALVEGFNGATAQWIGRTAQNRVLNFVNGRSDGTSLLGRYLDVRVTRAGPNSLIGEAVNLV